MPEPLKPFGIAERRSGGRQRQRAESTILTDSPVIKALQQRKRKSKVGLDVGQKRKGGKRKGKGKAKKSRPNDSDSEEEETHCLVCWESFSDSRPGERWIQCCARHLLGPIYHNCNSDAEWA